MIRRAVIEDAAGLASLLQDLALGGLESQPYNEVLKQVQRQLSTNLADDSHSLYIAELASNITAYAAVHWLPYLFFKRGGEGYVSELFVSASARGKGLGKGILEAIITEAKQRNCVRLQLVNIKDRPSYERGFYTKQGWQERPEAANFIYPL